MDFLLEREDDIQKEVFWSTASLLNLTAEVETGMTWPQIKRTMQRLNLVEFLTKDGRILQHTERIPDQRNILNKLKIKPPKSVLRVDLAA
jgi:hypothetical protein